MKNEIRKCLSILLFFITMGLELFAQAKSGLENYNFIGEKGTYYWMPVMHYESGKGGYGEIRYNYEDIATFSMYGGKRYSIGKKSSVSLTPMAGISVGNFSGISPALNMETGWNKLFLSVSSQYSISLDNRNPSFFFNWSEAGVTVCKGFFTGAAVQSTVTKGNAVIEPGIMAGIEIGKFSIPVYLFRPFSGNGFALVGVNVEYVLR